MPRTEGESAITRLIQGIYGREPAQARRVLRHRIYATAEPREMCWGMVRVAAKRLEAPCRLEDFPLAAGQEVIELHAPALSEVPEPLAAALGLRIGLQRDDRGFMELALKLAQHVAVREQRYLSNRRIAALLVSAQGSLLGWAVNSSVQDKTRHAEVNLIQAYCRKNGTPLPAGARVLTTLKSCKMCAGMIWSAASDPSSLRVLYAQDDPGPYARSTVLTPDSFERRRACAANTAGLEVCFEACLAIGSVDSV